jgi:hypothetical protein
MMDEPDDDGYRTDEQRLEDGWISEDVVEEIRALLKLVDYPDPFPRPGSRSDAAMILIEQHINPPKVIRDVSTGAYRPAMPEDPHVTWAKHLLKDVVG